MGVGFLFYVWVVHVRKVEGNDAFFVLKNKNSNHVLYHVSNIEFQLMV